MQQPAGDDHNDEEEDDDDHGVAAASPGLNVLSLHDAFAAEPGGKDVDDDVQESLVFATFPREFDGKDVNDDFQQSLAFYDGPTSATTPFTATSARATTTANTTTFVLPYLFGKQLFSILL